MKITFAKSQLPTQGALVAPVVEGAELPALVQQLDQAASGAVSRAIKAGRFEAKKDQSLTILAPAGSDLSRLVLIGLGKAEGDAAARFGGLAYAEVQTSGDAQVTIVAEGLDAARIGFGARLRSYRFDKYRTKEKPEDKPSVKKLSILTEDAAAKASFAVLDKVVDGIFLTRDVVSEPPNVIYPETLAEQCQKLTSLGLEVEVLGEKQMRKLGMGALLGVGQGSDKDSKLVVMRWQGGKDKDAAPLAFVGKGVCFDSGGISLKPGAGMEDMKWDMAGAGAVIGAMAALAGRKAKANVVGVVGLVENMPSGTAQRPSDVVTTMSGQTVEIINTDAEGRLVLADALTYTIQTFNPSAVVDLATLTGAIIISLGNEYGGLFSNNDDLSAKLLTAGQAISEPLWRMPMGDAYDKHLKSDIADMKNTGQREGGSISAAHFLQRFVGDVPWAHLDVAGVVWSKADAPLTPKGATAFGVRLLNELVSSAYEEK